MKIVNYLDVTLNLSTGQTKPYRKEDDETNYIHTESDHPSNIIRQLLLSIEKRLSKIYSSEEIFDEAKGFTTMKPYDEADTLTSFNTNPHAEKKQRKKR